MSSRPRSNAFKQSIAKVASDVQALTGSGDKAAAARVRSRPTCPPSKTSWDALYDAVGSACD